MHTFANNWTFYLEKFVNIWTILWRSFLPVAFCGPPWTAADPIGDSIVITLVHLRFVFLSSLTPWNRTSTIEMTSSGAIILSPNCHLQPASKKITGILTSIPGSQHWTSANVTWKNGTGRPCRWSNFDTHAGADKFSEMELKGQSFAKSRLKQVLFKITIIQFFLKMFQIALTFTSIEEAVMINFSKIDFFLK